jgi:DNA-binding transcriptional ArsR family regulator
MDAVFKALSDPCRRRLLDRLHARNGQNLTELCAGLGIARQSVTKHLAVLEAAKLVTTERRGRERLHYLNAAPINDIGDRWLGRYDLERARALADVKRALEESAMADTSFVYSTYIKTTPKQLWSALTNPAFTLRYLGAALHSDWQVGSPILWQSETEGEQKTLDHTVLESVPYRRLSYTRHTYQPEHAELFGWPDERLAELQQERRSKVSFDIEPVGTAVKLTLIHDDFEPGSPMLEAVAGRTPHSGGWPEVLAGLKTLLETGTTLDTDTPAAAAAIA